MRRVLITGGEGDLALEMKRVLEAAGYCVEAPGRESLDVSLLSSIESYFSEHPEPYHCVICNAGVTMDQLSLKLSADTFEEVLRTNLRGSQRVAVHGARGMIEHAIAGQVIFIGSISSVHGPIGQVAYASSKAALHGLNASLAKEWGEHGLRVNVIWPGFLETKMTQELSEDRVEEVRRSHSLGRFNQAQQVAEFVVFLDQKLVHTSGQIFNLDSRLHRWC